MAVIHHTTMKPTKLELLASWLPAQPWFRGTGRAPELAKAGGFRLDDPDGEVGIEFMVVTDASGGEPVAYHVPLAYRGAPLDGDDDALIGTSEHGVLGTRWIYDGIRDPVLLAQLVALLDGRIEAQAQSVSDTLDPSVVVTVPGKYLSAGSAPAVDPSQGTDITAGQRTLHVARVLQPNADPGIGGISTTWRLPDDSLCRGTVVVLRAGS